MTVPPYNPETCSPMSFQDPHQPCYKEPRFNPVQHGYGAYGLAGYPMPCEAYFPQPIPMPSSYA